MKRKNLTKTTAAALAFTAVLETGYVSTDLFDEKAFAAEKTTESVLVKHTSDSTTSAAVTIDTSDADSRVLNADLIIKDPNVTTSSAVSVDLSYQWYKDGTEIAGAQGRTYTVPVEEEGKFKVHVDLNYKGKDYHVSSTEITKGKENAMVIPLDTISVNYGVTRQQIINSLSKEVSFYNSSIKAPVRWCNDFVYDTANINEQVLTVYGTTIVPSAFVNGGTQLSITQQVKVSAKNAIKLGKVTIDGTERVGKKLEAEVKDSNGNKVTSGLTYRWYRLKKKDSAEDTWKLVETDSEYKLVSSDEDKYIKLIVSNSQGSVEDITGKIDERSSSSHHHYDDDDDDDVKEVYGTVVSGSDGTVLESNASAIEVNSNGGLSLVNANGQLVSGWQCINGNWYLGDKIGNVLTGWQISNGSWYFMGSDGVMKTGWQNLNGSWYYFNPVSDGTKGSMKTGWQYINNAWYYMYDNGIMASNTYIGSYYVGSNGAWDWK